MAHIFVRNVGGLNLESSRHPSPNRNRWKEVHRVLVANSWVCSSASIWLRRGAVAGFIIRWPKKVSFSSTSLHSTVIRLPKNCENAFDYTTNITLPCSKQVCTRIKKLAELVDIFLLWKNPTATVINSSSLLIQHGLLDNLRCLLFGPERYRQQHW